jgi:hypothetical protein
MKHFARRLNALGRLDRIRFPFRSDCQTRHSATVPAPESSTRTPFRKTWKIPFPFRHRTPVIPYIPPNSTSNFPTISPAVPPTGFFQSSARLQSTFLTQVLEITCLNLETHEKTQSLRSAFSPFPSPPLRVTSRPFAVPPSNRLHVTTPLLITATQQVCAMKHFARRLNARGRLDRSSFPFRSGVQTRRKQRSDTVQTQSQTHQSPRKTRINTHNTGRFFTGLARCRSLKSET